MHPIGYLLVGLLAGLLPLALVLLLGRRKSDLTQPLAALARAQRPCLTPYQSSHLATGLAKSQ